MRWKVSWTRENAATILDQEQEFERRKEAWLSLDVEQQNYIKSGLVAATEKCRDGTVLLSREPIDSRRRNSIDLIVGTGVLSVRQRTPH